MGRDGNGHKNASISGGSGQGSTLATWLAANLTQWSVVEKRYRYQDIYWQWSGSAWIPADPNPTWDALHERTYIILTNGTYEVCISCPNGTDVYRDEAIPTGTNGYRDNHTTSALMRMSVSFAKAGSYDGMASIEYYAGDLVGVNPPLHKFPWEYDWWAGFDYDLSHYTGKFEGEPQPTYFVDFRQWWNAMPASNFYVIEDDANADITFILKSTTTNNIDVISMGNNLIDTTIETNPSYKIKNEGLLRAYGTAALGSMPGLEMQSFTWSEGNTRMVNEEDDVDLSVITGMVNANQPNPSNGKYLTQVIPRFGSGNGRVYGHWHKDRFRIMGRTTETLHLQLGDDTEHRFIHVMQDFLCPFDYSLVF